MNKLTVFLVGCVLVAGAALAQVYNLFQPGGDLAGAGSTWNSQVIANNAITTVKINAAAVDLTTKVTGKLPAANVGPAGSTGQVQYNLTGALAASPDMTFSTSSEFHSKLQSFSSGGVNVPSSTAPGHIAFDRVGGVQYDSVTSGTLFLFDGVGDFRFLTALGAGSTFTALFQNTSVGDLTAAVFAVANGSAVQTQVGVQDSATTLANAYLLGGPAGAAGFVTTTAAAPLSFGVNLVEKARINNGIILGAPTGGDKGLGTVNATGLFVNGVAVPPAILSGTTGSIGGGALLAGQCSSGTVTITGATTSMVALADPQTYPGDGTIWDGQVTSANTVTVKVCAIIALSPGASLYNVRVLQ